MSHKTIAFIGGGNMARALIGGLLRSGHPAGAIQVADPSDDARVHLVNETGVQCFDDNIRATENAEVILLAVKPAQLADVCRRLGPAVAGRRPLLISIAAGTRCADIHRWLGAQLPLVRVMPNTPALIGAGASALWADSQVDAQQREIAEHILGTAGITLWVDKETDLDIVTAISGSGPAYFFLFIEALSIAGEQLGLPAETAARLAHQTALGAARMTLESGEDPATLRRRVTSPGGTTERGIATLEAGGLRELVARATAAAHVRAGELADTAGDH